MSLKEHKSVAAGVPAGRRTLKGREHQKLPARPAFTIVEAVIVVFIIGVISAIALPRYAGLVAQQRAEATARRIIADLAYAQRHARLTSTELTVHFEIGEEYYELQGLSDPDRPGQPYMVKLDAEPFMATIVSADLDANHSVVFDGFGRPDSGGTVVIRVGGYQKTILVDADTGRATVSSQEVIP